MSSIGHNKYSTELNQNYFQTAPLYKEGSLHLNLDINGVCAEIYDIGNDKKQFRKKMTQIENFIFASAKDLRLKYPLADKYKSSTHEFNGIFGHKKASSQSKFGQNNFLNSTNNSRFNTQKINNPYYSQGINYQMNQGPWTTRNFNMPRGNNFDFDLNNRNSGFNTQKFKKIKETKTYHYKPRKSRISLGSNISTLSTNNDWINKIKTKIQNENINILEEMRKVDLDNDGLITKNELINCLKKVRIFLESKEKNGLIVYLKTNNNWGGLVCIKEFAKFFE